MPAPSAASRDHSASTLYYALGNPRALAKEKTVTINLVVEHISNILVSVAAIVASYVALKGLHTWRREYVGRRQIDLAEQVLALFYEVKDVIAGARGSFTFPGEGSTRKAIEDETPEQTEIRNHAYVLIERLNGRADLFARLRSLRYRFMAQHGKDAATPFDDLAEIRAKLVGSSRALARLLERLQRPMLSPDELKRLWEQIEKTEAIYHEGDPDEDPIAKTVEGIIAAIEETCQPMIVGRRRHD